LDFELKDLLDAIGPNATLIFAAWIFLTVLQSRYTSAYDRYRALVSTFRDGNPQGARRQSLVDQVALYKKRCEEMRFATNLGIYSAVLLIGGLIVAGVNVIAGDKAILKVIAAAALLAGLAAVIWAALTMLRENYQIQEAIEKEPSDVEGLRQAVAQEPGRARDQMR
jgi:hypothetical protein